MKKSKTLFILSITISLGLLGAHALSSHDFSKMEANHDHEDKTFPWYQHGSTNIADANPMMWAKKLPPNDQERKED